ncbi:hypothetical protein PPEP_a2852 [Pseudoalteromonas peptidolytica F12-50-A1]|uniref:Uncharacterized protein n=1 Tax=Pseudoalteromonas peptidolytica F12-50-A1 TaxID=1315280 RepID=A0A8I0T4W2_9GAMM|nr:hypothetical protein [Pseudoalteromonas peptidolytica F12-50-A1]
MIAIKAANIKGTTISEASLTPANTMKRDAKTISVLLIPVSEDTTHSFCFFPILKQTTYNENE